jgi:RHH-type rel operon transcriptional repressor/antitoxin RelB
MLFVRLDPALERRLENLARRTGRTKTYYIAELIERHFARMETRYLAALEKGELGKEKRPTKRGTEPENRNRHRTQFPQLRRRHPQLAQRHPAG